MLCKAVWLLVGEGGVHMGAGMAVAVVAAAGLLAQSDTPPGGVTLMPGYAHRKLSGADSNVGEIAKQGGLTIRYDIGGGAGSHIKSLPADRIKWRREQMVAGGSVHVVGTTTGHLVATFPKAAANFTAAVKSEADVADFLLTVLTYIPPRPKE